MTAWSPTSQRCTRHGVCKAHTRSPWTQRFRRWDAGPHRSRQNRAREAVESTKQQSRGRTVVPDQGGVGRHVPLHGLDSLHAPAREARLLHRPLLQLGGDDLQVTAPAPVKRIAGTCMTDSCCAGQHKVQLRQREGAPNGSQTSKAVTFRQISRHGADPS